MKTAARAAPLIVAALAGLARGDDAPRRALEFAPAPVDNPLKGLVPYAADVRDFFPHSLEFDYLPLSRLVVGRDRYDWEALEDLLDEIAGRGHQAVFRVYMEYPDKAGAIPEYLIKGGLKVHKYVNTNTQPLPPAKVETPDYADPDLRAMLKSFIAAMGAKYDGDPRIGFITAGLLGTWGEWHTYPRDDLFASKEVQAEVMDAYEKAFQVTPVLLRYPSGPGTDAKADNARRPFGYHDDSFCWATLHTGKEEDDWFYMTALKEAGALDKWKTEPIGGEIRPEAWGRVFDDDPGLKAIQPFARCVEETHASWLMDSGLFEERPPEGRVDRAKVKVRRLGYELHVPGVTIAPPEDGMMSVRVELENRGVAPFYYDWPVEFALLADGEPTRTFRGRGKVTGLLPGDPARLWEERLDVKGLKGEHQLAVRVPNALPNGHPLRFANKTQDQHAKGWLTLGPVTIP